MADIGQQSPEAYASALFLLGGEWMHGHFGDNPSPPADEGRVCLTYLETFPRNCDPIELDVAYQELERFNVVRHFDQAASHRRWLDLWFQLIKVADVDVDVGLQTVVEVHDLSKYSPGEALGYGIMFGETGKFKQLEGRQKELWDLALVSHYSNNPHHPQFREGQTMEDVHLQESVLDMLACRSERTLASATSVTPYQLVDIPDTFLDRYIPEDRSRVKFLLSKWLQKLEAVIEDRGTEEVIGQWEEATGKKLVLQDCSECGERSDCQITGKTVPSLRNIKTQQSSHSQCCFDSVDSLKKCVG